MILFVRIKGPLTNRSIIAAAVVLEKALVTYSSVTTTVKVIEHAVCTYCGIGASDIVPDKYIGTHGCITAAGGI